MTSPRLDHPVAAVAHLTPELWRKVNRLLVRKAIAAFAAVPALQVNVLPFQREQFTTTHRSCKR